MRPSPVVQAATAAHHHGFFTGLGWSQGATIFAAVSAAATAALIAVSGYTHQRKAQRRVERATLYGQAIASVEAYLEGPYRIRRKDGTAATRFAITTQLSDTKTAISLHTALIQMHAPPAVSIAFEAFVSAATREAGPQMTEAWHAPETDGDGQVPLGTGYDRTASDLRRSQLVKVMKADLGALE